MFANPRKATTVSIIRNNENKIEVLLMRRHHNDRFLPDYYVFPGGAVDNQDYDFDLPFSSRTGELKKFGPIPKDYYGSIICGIRETFEESGILLAVDENGNYPVINTAESVGKFSLYRKNVFEHKISFREMLTREKLYPAMDNFFYIDRWITPPLFPIRYDARFFAVKAPDNQEISHDGLELVDFEWMTPGEALDRKSKKIIKLVTPTIKTLVLLNKFNLTDDVISYLQK